MQILVAHEPDPPHRKRPTFDGSLYSDDEARRQRFDIVASQHSRDAGRSARGRRVNRDDIGMGVGRAQDRGMQRAGASPEIVDETTTSRQ